jgi:hypothetical protein
VSRQLPSECEHGKVYDWGGFGGDDESSPPEFCGECPPATKPPKRTRQTQTFMVPMAGATPIVFAGPFPLTEDEWTYFGTVLEAMKPGLVSALPLPVSSGVATGEDNTNE